MKNENDTQILGIGANTQKMGIKMVPKFWAA